ncbi:hypothetical protein [Kordia sp.]|uniref:hypothetical protein n=1 Tax=Kordia sp. TaxID=1965332 RepID=UPI0025C1A4E0|nr:hypothetical protein [Kordia sp.]MCH2194394.1 hypothetical protein [Kordia sp.]
MSIQIKINQDINSGIKINSLESSINELLEKLTISDLSKLSKINSTALKNVVKLSDNDKAIETLSTKEGMEVIETFLS